MSPLSPAMVWGHPSSSPHSRAGGELCQKLLCKCPMGPTSLNLQAPTRGPLVILASPRCSRELQPPPSWLQPLERGLGNQSPAHWRQQQPALNPLCPSPAKCLGDADCGTCEHPPCTQPLPGFLRLALPAGFGMVSGCCHCCREQDVPSGDPSPGAERCEQAWRGLEGLGAAPGASPPPQGCPQASRWL